MKKKLAIIGFLVIIIVLGAAVYYKLTNLPDKVEAQQALEAEYIDQLESGNFTIDNPLVIANPYQSNELAAYVGFDSEQPVTYEYTVKGKIPFTYSSTEVTNQVIIPVVGLYNDTVNKVEINTFDSEGTEIASNTIEISTTDTGIAKELNTAKVEVYNQKQFDKFMDGRFFIDNYTNIYDKNGDLRAANIAPDSDYAYMKVVNNQFLVADKWSSESKYKKVLFSYSVMGRINPDFYFVSPEGTKFHHDLTTDGEKVYALTSSISDESDYAQSMKESLVSVYDMNGKLLETIDLTPFFDDQANLPNMGANANDLHLNSIDYYQPENMLIIDSRSLSGFFGYSLDTNQVEWIFDDVDTLGSDLQEIALKPVGKMEYPSGEHTAFVANDYLKDVASDELYISIFDNRQCIDKNYQEVTKTFAEDENVAGCTEIAPEGLKSRAILYKINLTDKTIETVDTIDFTTYSSFKGGFNILPNGYKETYVANATTFEVYDQNNELVVTYKLNTNENENVSEEEAFLYRANSFTTETFQNFVEINQ